MVQGAVKASQFEASEEVAFIQNETEKTVNHVIESPSSDGFSGRGDRTPPEESKMKVETDDTLVTSGTVKNLE
ncbi:hypothetical protein DID88_002290 [Monilinia fructigena]|uniref:Uncharacterized protein n=1 Tax=Monilinia fructigena TaxID=38457 RepID=A0A395IDG2_9HELO|nr:hypothetical protein DID88_002290 [Monilinia fructigena]